MVAGPDFLRDDRPADDIAPLERRDLQAGLRQIGGADQAIMSRADDHRIE